MPTDVVVTSGPSLRDPFLAGLLDSWQGSPPVVYTDDNTGLFSTSDIPGWLDVQPTLAETGDPDGIKPDSFRWNARKFAVKCFVWRDAAERIGEGVLTWLDADVVQRTPIPDGFWGKVLRGMDVAYLGRGTMHPDTGYVGFRLPACLPLLRACCDLYTSGEYRRIKDGWTDCHVFRQALKRSKLRRLDLTTDTAKHWRSTVDAMALSPLGPYLHHLKGKQRKREALAS